MEDADTPSHSHRPRTNFPELHIDEIPAPRQRAGTVAQNAPVASPMCWEDSRTQFHRQTSLGRMVQTWAASSESWHRKLDDIATGDSALNLGILNDVRATNMWSRARSSVCRDNGVGLNRRRGQRLVLRNTDIGQRKIGVAQGRALELRATPAGAPLVQPPHDRAPANAGRIQATDGSVSTPPRIDLIYDARNIRFEDLGLSPRMIDSLRDDFGADSIEDLSDVLRWLLNHGIRVRLGIDRKRLDEDGVRDLITSVGAP